MNRRPTSLIVVTVAWLLLGAWQLLGATFDLLNIIGVQIAVSRGGITSPYSAYFVLGTWGLVVLKWAIAVLIVVSAYCLWQLRPWARKSLEIISWVFLTLTVAFGIFWMYMFLEATSSMPRSARSTFEWMSWVALGVFTGVGTALGVSVGLLRSHAIRSAVAPETPAEEGDDQLTPSARRYVIPSVPS